MQKVLITGAASGLGRALALRFAKEGADICVADINAEGSKETVTMIEAAGGKGWTAHLDVTVPEQWEALRHDVEERWGGIDVVINNAGVATGDRIDAGEWAWWEWIIDINLKGVALGCRTFTPMMKNQNSGYIMNTASLAGLMVLPSMASYNVTKAGVIALSETMHFELDAYNIKVTALCPGFFRTNLDKTMKTSDPSMLKFVDKVFEKSELTADEVADRAYRSLMKGELICNPHPIGRKAVFIKRYLGFLLRWQLRKASVDLKRRELEAKAKKNSA